MLESSATGKLPHFPQIMEAARPFIYVGCMANTPSRTTPLSTVRDVTGSGFPALTQPDWVRAFPWVVQGTTMHDSGDEAPFDLGLFAAGSDPEAARRRWRILRERLGADRVVHAQQVHGSHVRVHHSNRPAVEDPHLVDPCDGHATDMPGVILAVTIADCVPVFIVDPERRAVAAVHAGWRGAACGVLERALHEMASSFASRPEALHVHLGPAICGMCYEVGPEVFKALGQPVPKRPTPIDLRNVLGQRAVGAGVPNDAVTVSAHCTVCTASGLFSHRSGHDERQVGFIGVRA